MESFFPPMILVDPAGNSLLRRSMRTIGAPDAGAAVLPVGGAGLGADAGDIMVWSFVLERRGSRGALGNNARASRVKTAARPRGQRVPKRTGNRLQRAVPAALDSGNRFREAARLPGGRVSDTTP